MADYDIERQREILKKRELERSITAANQNSTIARIVNIVYYLFGSLEFLLAVRIVLRLMGANPDNGFANLIYALSSPFVMLFSNLLKNPAISPTSVLEITTMIAMLVYAIVAWLIGRLIWLSLSRPR